MGDGLEMETLESTAIDVLQLDDIVFQAPLSTLEWQGVVDLLEKLGNGRVSSRRTLKMTLASGSPWRRTTRRSRMLLSLAPTMSDEPDFSRGRIVRGILSVASSAAGRRGWGGKSWPARLPKDFDSVLFTP